MVKRAVKGKAEPSGLAAGMVLLREEQAHSLQGWNVMATSEQKGRNNCKACRKWDHVEP
jgi:hypothetical protein